MKAIPVLLSTLVMMAVVSGCDNKSQKLEQQSQEVESLKKELAELKAKEKQDEETKRLQEQISTITQGEVDGQVFIVTKSRENVKMGLVTVSLFDADYVRKTLISLRKDLLTRADGMLTNTKPILASAENLRSDYETNKAAYETAKEEEESSEKKLIDQFNSIPGQTELYDANVEPMYLDGLDGADTIARKKAVYSEFHDRRRPGRQGT